jgi:hypothetical protein
MPRNQLIASRLREVFLDGHWVANTNYKTLILSLNWEQATVKIADVNTIAALIYHINYYLAGLLSAYDTGTLEIRDKYSFDLPPIHSAEDWDTLVVTFLDNAEKFAQYVEQMPDEVFDQPFVAPQYGTNLRNIEAILEHAYYHLGQISLIRKILLESV